jgi:methylenetetrahydrofolate reductase (NADPH)
MEFFPPGDKGKWPSFFRTVERLKSVKPLFVSVTYGAMGKTQKHTLEIVKRLHNEYGLETMAHLTCVGASRRDVSDFLGETRASGIDNVLALRGDLPVGCDVPTAVCENFKNASDLVRFIRKGYPGLGVAVAAYPEGHPEAASTDDDLMFLKKKLDAGADFAITQLFFDNRFYWAFLEKAKKIGINKPIIPGILPIFNLSSVKKIVDLCGAAIPEDYRSRLSNAQADGGDKAIRAIGIEHARKQIKDLLSGGATGVHLYTLNRSEAILEVIAGSGLA